MLVTDHQVTYPALAIKFLLYHLTFLLILTITCKSAPCGGLLRLVGKFGTKSLIKSHITRGKVVTAPLASCRCT